MTNGIGRAYLIRADVRGTLPLADQSVQCVVTSPPFFGLRDYNDHRQIGLERTPAEYVARIVDVFREVKRVLRDDGCAWLNLGDSYARDNMYEGRRNIVGQDNKDRARSYSLCRGGLKSKDLIGIPWRVALALQDDGWWLRSDVLWIKRNPMRESMRDRPTKAHEYIFMLTKRNRYYYDNHGERTPAARPGDIQTFGGQKALNNEIHPGDPRYRNGSEQWGRTVQTGLDGANLLTWWDIPVAGFPGAHFACFPPELPARCIRLGTSERGCCPKCAAPYSRVLAKDRKATRPGINIKVFAKSAEGDTATADRNGWNRANVIGNRDPQRHTTSTKTIGWEPGCSCDAGEPIGCKVLDIFSGSGTTAAVARELGRVGIGLEVNADYLELARDRVRRPTIGRDNPSLVGPSRVAPLPGQLEIDFQ